MRMHLMQQVKQLEVRARQMSERELCPHLPPIIRWADGSSENESPHACGKPRLVISITLSDGTDQRTQNVAFDLFQQYRTEFGYIPPETLLGWCEEFLPLTPETRAVLRERVKGMT